MSKLSIATWNINSVRLRAGLVAAYLAEHAPDILCLQEIKCRDGEFPEASFRDAGYPHMLVAGQKGLHGVAIVSRVPLERVEAPQLCREGHARVISARIGDGAGAAEIHNIYLPAGGDVPDPEENPKFAHKLDFVARLGDAYARLNRDDPRPRLLLGDLNIAPHENDVWSHRQLLDVVSHTPVETEGLEAARTGSGFSDIARLRHPPETKLYTWWSYRAADWLASNRGRRLDHIWANDSAMTRVDIDSFIIHAGWRGRDKPSDHVPVSVGLTLR